MRALAPSLVWAPGGQRGWGREEGGLGSGAVTSRSRGPRAGRAGWDSQLPGPIQTCWSPTLLLAQGNWARPGGMHWRGWGAGAGQAVAVLLRGPQGWGYDIGAPLCPPSGPGSGWPEPVPDQSAPPLTSVSPSEKQDRLLIRSDSLAGLWNPWLEDAAYLCRPQLSPHRGEPSHALEGRGGRVPLAPPSPG